MYEIIILYYCNYRLECSFGWTSRTSELLGDQKSEKRHLTDIDYMLLYQSFVFRWFSIGTSDLSNDEKLYKHSIWCSCPQVKVYVYIVLRCNHNRGTRRLRLCSRSLCDRLEHWKLGSTESMVCVSFQTKTPTSPPQIQRWWRMTFGKLDFGCIRIASTSVPHDTSQICWDKVFKPRLASLIYTL